MSSLPITSCTMKTSSRRHCLLEVVSMVLLLLVVGSCLVAEAKHQLCVHPPAWTFYDIASHYADTGNLSRSSLSSPVLTTNSTASSSSSSSSIILESNASYFRSPLQQIRGNITLVVLTNMKELTKRNEQQISNLELIYRSMRTANFSDIRFVLINSKDAFSPSWVHSIRGQVSFEVYQELESNPIWSQLDGGNGDMFIYDRCGLLTYYIPFPLSFIHTQQPILQAALLATYFESPCRDVCNTTALPNAVTTTSANVTVVTANDTSNELNVSSKPHLSSPLNETSGTILLKITNQTLGDKDEQQPQQQQHGTNMGQILMKFFELFRSTPSSKTSDEEHDNRTTLDTSDIGQKMNETMGRLNATEHIRTEASPTEHGNKTSNSTEGIGNTGTPSPSIANLSSSTLLGRLREQTKQQSSSRCEQTKCHEWSFERLLKARLCCLNSQNYAEDTANEAGNTASSASGGSSLLRRWARNTGDGNGCQQYKHDRCGLILPVIKCCLQKELNNYFDRVIRKRAQQQRQQLGGAGGVVLLGAGSVAHSQTQPGLSEGRGTLLAPRVELGATGGGQMEAISVDSLLMAASARAGGVGGERQSYHKRDQIGRPKLC